MDRQTSDTRADTDQTDDLARASGTGVDTSRSQSAGVIDGGFLLASVTAPGPGYTIRLDYSGTGPNGETASGLVVDLLSTISSNLKVGLFEEVFFGDLRGFERLEITGPARGGNLIAGTSGDDVINPGAGGDLNTTLSPLHDCQPAVMIRQIELEVAVHAG